MNIGGTEKKSKEVRGLGQHVMVVNNKLEKLATTCRVSGTVQGRGLPFRCIILRSQSTINNVVRAVRVSKCTFSMNTSTFSSEQTSVSKFFQRLNLRDRVRFDGNKGLILFSKGTIVSSIVSACRNVPLFPGNV